MKSEYETDISRAHVAGSKFHGERNVWKGMLARCQNPNSPAYKNYGGRGIKVCERWQSFRCFLDDMGPRPKGLFIERINNDLGYCPSNCKWATRHEQSRNRRNNCVIGFNGKYQCLVDWAEETGINRNVIAGRLNRGWTPENALTEPLTKQKKLSFKGETLTVAEWSIKTGLSVGIIRHRLKKGKSVSEVLDQRTGQGRIYEYKGEFKTISEWADCLGISRALIKQRLKRGWSFFDSVERPPKDVSKILIEFQGKTQSLDEWSLDTGLSKGTIKSRIRNGWSLERALTTGTRKRKDRQSMIDS